MLKCRESISSLKYSDTIYAVHTGFPHSKRVANDFCDTFASQIPSRRKSAGQVINDSICPRFFNYVGSSVTNCSCFVNQASQQREKKDVHRNWLHQTDSQFRQQEPNILKDIHRIDYHCEREYSQNICDSGLSSEYLINMNSERRNFNSSQESQCPPFTFQSHQKNEFVQSNPNYHENFRYSQGNFQMNNASLYKQIVPNPGRFPQKQNNIENNFQLNSAEFDLPQSKVDNLDSVSQELGYSRNLLHKNRNFTDSVVSNQHFSIDSSGTLNFRELQPLNKQYQAENIGHTIPETHEWRTSYQEHPQSLDMQQRVPIPPIPGQFSQEICVSKENFHLCPSDFKSRNQDMYYRENAFQIKHHGGYVGPDYTNINNPTLSNQYLANETLLSLNQQFIQENMMVHSSQQFQGNRAISEEFHKTFQKLDGLPKLADTEQSRHIEAACNNQGIQQSMIYTNENLFQGEHHVDYSYPEKTNIKNSTFSNQYLANEEPLPLNQQWLQENVPNHSSHIYIDNRMISKELPETFDVKTCLPRLPDTEHSVYIQTSWNKQSIQQSSTYTGGNSVFCTRNNPTSDMENNPHQVNKPLDFLKNSNLGSRSDDQWDKSPTYGEVNVPFCTTDHQNQETVTKATTSDEQNRQKVNIFNSYARKSSEFLALTFPLSTHDKNTADYSKTSSLESNTIHCSSQQHENWVQCNISTNADRYENLTTLHANESNKFQGYNHLTNSSQEESKYRRNHNLQTECKGRFSKREIFADSQCKSIFSTAKSLFHPQVHCEQRPFTYNMCPGSFKRRSTLEYHIRTHTNERPHQSTRGLFWDGPQNFEHWSDDEDDTSAVTPSPNFHAQNLLFKLNTFNSVFQAELAAIEFAVNWAVKEKVKVNIHIDSLSSISAINSANTRSEFVNKVKSNIFKAKNMVGLSWVKAHKNSWKRIGRPTSQIGHNIR
ncbi:hypothetical protein AVEN_99985-1 [Araneus ventricosus]|uniref:C2H2-type domain-containing protein n=1 Tax=Araneus ventricosus TaxID=182803 RepID=A0A4Y2JTL6_ARAVE|nr:hypothetical protein AVEN_99985-1 [Araneus ventricosus]